VQKQINQPEHVYVVCKIGVHVRGIMSLHFDINTAKKAATKSATMDVDSYHKYDVIKIPLDEISKNTDDYDERGWNDEKIIFRARKVRKCQ
jgi:hypothetical protein